MSYHYHEVHCPPCGKVHRRGCSLSNCTTAAVSLEPFTSSKQQPALVRVLSPHRDGITDKEEIMDHLAEAKTRAIRADGVDGTERAQYYAQLAIAHGIIALTEIMDKATHALIAICERMDKAADRAEAAAEREDLICEWPIAERRKGCK